MTTTTQIELPPLNIQTIDITVIGDTPLICHAWSEKAKKQNAKLKVGKRRRRPNPIRAGKRPKLNKLRHGRRVKAKVSDKTLMLATYRVNKDLADYIRDRLTVIRC